MASKVSAKTRQKRKKIFYRIMTITVAVVMVGGILLATLLSPWY